MFTIDDWPRDYQGLDKYLGDKSSKMLCNNTVASRWEESGRKYIEVSLHGHTILQFAEVGVILAGDCGYRTVTTKQRLNHVMRQYGYNIYSKNYTWYVAHNGNRGESQPWRGRWYYENKMA